MVLIHKGDEHRIIEHRGRFAEGNSMPPQVPDGFIGVPLESGFRHWGFCHWGMPALARDMPPRVVVFNKLPLAIENTPAGPLTQATNGQLGLGDKGLWRRFRKGEGNAKGVGMDEKG